MVEGDLLPQAVLRQIGDKLYEKRKLAALEVEQIIKRLAAHNDQHRIRLIVDKLISDFAFSALANHRKGALLCLAAAAVGLGDPSEVHLRQIVPPVLASFTDQDARVRYYACEALYNIAKVARGTFILFFNEVFDAMFRLCADSETNVQSAVQFLDALIKDIVAASPVFDLPAFVPKLRDYLRVTNPHKRQFLISWVVVLDSLPHVSMLRHLPALLGGLLSMLAEPVKEVRQQVANCLKDFLSEVRGNPPPPELDPEFFPRLTATLVDKASSPDELTRLTAIRWLHAFVELPSPIIRALLLGHVPAILGVVLANISAANPDIQKECSETNTALLCLQQDGDFDVIGGGMRQGGMDMAAILGAVIREMTSEMEATRLEALRWVHFLLTHAREQVLAEVDRLLAPLLDALSGLPSERVVSSALGVIAALAKCPGQFTPVLVAFLDRFRGDAGAQLLQRSASSMVRRLCGALGGREVLTQISIILQAEQDLAFASTLVQALNLILLTGPELQELRDQLRDAVTNPSGAQLFAELYPAWSHSAGALLSLCFSAQAYDHAVDIVKAFGVLPFGAELLVQVDRLIALLETPCFTFLRLQLLAPRQHPALLRALYSLLMLLPQCNAFRLLNTRLQAVPTLALLQLDLTNDHDIGAQQPQLRFSGDVACGSKWADFASLLEVFKVVQRRQYDADVARQQLLPLLQITSGGSMGGAAGAGLVYSGMQLEAMNGAATPFTQPTKPMEATTVDPPTALASAMVHDAGRQALASFGSTGSDLAAKAVE